MAIRLTCPYCNTFSHFENQGPNIGWKGGAHIVAPCHACAGPVYIHVEGENVLDSYPKLRTSVDPSYPEVVAEAMTEALKSLNVGNPLSCATMCRRAIQGAVKETVAKGSTLNEQIGDLATKGEIAKQLAEWAHETRLSGNLAAHPDELGRKVTLRDAQEVFEFTETFLEYLYVLPKKLTERRQSAADRELAIKVWKEQHPGLQQQS